MSSLFGPRLVARVVKGKIQPEGFIYRLRADGNTIVVADSPIYSREADDWPEISEAELESAPIGYYRIRGAL